MDIVAFDDDVSQVDADAEPEPVVLVSLCFVNADMILPGHGAVHGVHHAGELDQQPVAHELDDASMILGDQRFENVVAQLRQTPKRAGFVGAHQGGIADHIGGKYGD